ncbi:MAG: CHAD domain-containing protein, partial [Bacteroidales bacterium]|nr:CHAD domain-containing protein [Bacteroidales bacterium]
NRTLKDLTEKFLGAGERIRALPVENDGFEVFAGGMQRIYRQGRKYFSSARQNPGMHHLHDMRKRIKYLWYQIEILRPIHPGLLKAISDSLENISEDLGVYHDLDVLTEFLQNNKTNLEKRIQETLLDACELKKTTMLPGIWRQAGPVFSEKPTAFVGRINEYWRFYCYPTE